MEHSDIFKKNEISFPAKPQTLISMPMFTDGVGYNLQDVLSDLKSTWGLAVSDIDGDNTSAVFKIDGARITLALIPTQIPSDDIERTAGNTCNWPTAAEDLKAHNAHAIVSIMDGHVSAVERHIIFSKVLSAILSTSNAVGICHGTHTLLISKSQYLSDVEALKWGKIPLLLWIYIGIRKSPDGNSFYTQGLDAFGKQEMEIVNSPMKLEDVYMFMLNISAYVVGRNITVKGGETLGYAEKYKIKIRSSKGVFVEGQTLKLAMELPSGRERPRLKPQYL
jgi:hypothetical protein